MSLLPSRPNILVAYFLSEDRAWDIQIKLNMSYSTFQEKRKAQLYEMKEFNHLIKKTE